ncbi:MAG: hypothetical protein KDD64_05885 [Bdellovibrionales bacterium]|nr:hypothetical protein [Bdellovibrionales bacterium]
MINSDGFLKSGSLFRRGKLFLSGGRVSAEKRSREQQCSVVQQKQTSVVTVPVESEACSVLVINSGRDMAREITHQLTMALPGCSMTFAPSFELARWILRRRTIDLIVSSPILPDGGIEQLQSELNTMECPPDLVVVGEVTNSGAQALGELGYQFAKLKKLGSGGMAQAVNFDVNNGGDLREKVKELGADIRNDLNNPLQEIVAMVFVAQAAGQAAPMTNKALTAIDQAAKNMANYVNRLEQKIEKVVVNR